MVTFFLVFLIMKCRDNHNDLLNIIGRPAVWSAGISNPFVSDPTNMPFAAGPLRFNWPPSANRPIPLRTPESPPEVTSERSSGWHGALADLEDMDDRELSVDGPSLYNLLVGDIDALDAASDLSLTPRRRTDRAASVGKNALNYPEAEVLDDDVVERVAEAYEECMVEYLKQKPSFEEIVTELSLLVPTASSLKPLVAGDFLDLDGPRLAVALQVAAVSGPSVWVPLHMELRRRCGYVR